MPTSIPIRPCPRLPALQLSQDQQRLRTSTHLYSSSLKSKSTSSLWKKKKKNVQTCRQFTFLSRSGGGLAVGGTGLCHRPLLPDVCLRAGEGPFVEFKKATTPKQRRRRRHRTTGFHFDLRGGKGTFSLSLQTSRPLTLQQKKKKKQQDRTEDTRSARSDGHKTLYRSIRPPQNRGDSGLVAVAAGPGGRRALPSPRAGEAVPRGHPAGNRGAGSGGSGEQRGGRRGAGGRQAQVASGLSTGMSPPQPPSPYCWYGGIWGASMISSPSGDKEAKTVMGSTS